MRYGTRILTAALALCVAACHGGTDKATSNGGTGSSGAPPTYKVGATNFISQSPNAQSRGGTYEAADGAGNTGSATGGGGAAPGSADNAGGSGSSGSDRTITEADVYKVVGTTLYVLNQYRGLQVLDLSDAAHPKLIARVPVLGYPVDLYVDGNTAYVIVSDVLLYGVPIVTPGSGGVTTTPWIGSQVWAVDVTNPAAPAVKSQLPVEGFVSESRMVGDVLYVVSDVWSWYEFGNTSGQDLTYVESFNVADPSGLAAVQRLDFPKNGWDIHANVTQSRIVLAESGWNYGQDANGNWYDNPTTQFQPIDISDPSGALVLGNAFNADGQVQDRWAMDFNPATGVFRAVVENSYWQNTGGKLEIWSAPTIQSATLTGTLNLNVSEAITAASFDGDRAYIVSAYCTDPLWIVDTSNPANPVVTGSVQLSGAIDFIEPRGNQLIALGHDSSGCVAWEGGGHLAVSLFDVTDAAHPTLTSRVGFGGEYAWINATNDDMKKAFQVIDSLGLILVPFQSWDQSSWSYQGGTQLVDLNAQGLTLRGFAGHAGFIKRAFPMGNNLVALSDRTMQVLDATDRDHPTTVSQIDLARPVIAVTLAHGQAIELSGDWSLGDTELAVTDAATPDQNVPSATLDVPSPYARMFRDGDIVWLLATDYSTGSSWLQAVDVSNPLAPQQRGKLNLDPTQVGYVYDSWWYWGYGAEAAVTNHALVMHPSYWGCWEDGPCGGTQADKVYVVDLRNPDAPSLSTPVTLPDSAWSWGLIAQGDFAWITHYTWVPGLDGYVQYELDRVDLTNPANPQLTATINVPGVLFAASDDGQTIYTQDVTWDANWQNPTTWLNKLQLWPGNFAQLVASQAIAGYPDGAQVQGDYAYLQTWNYGSSTSQATLSAIHLDDLHVTSAQQLGSQWAWLRKAAGGKLFLEAYWYDEGLLVYDLANPAQPTFQGSVRTEGWINDIVVDGNTAYLPSNEYGVPMLDLTPGSPLVVKM